jgi:hypothetical protein
MEDEWRDGGTRAEARGRGGERREEWGGDFVKQGDEGERGEGGKVYISGEGKKKSRIEARRIGASFPMTTHG